MEKKTKLTMRREPYLVRIKTMQINSSCDHISSQVESSGAVTTNHFDSLSPGARGELNNKEADKQPLTDLSQQDLVPKGSYPDASLKSLRMGYQCAKQDIINKRDMGLLRSRLERLCAKSS